MNAFIDLMKSELMLSLIIFGLLLIRLGKGLTNQVALSLTQVLLLLNVIIAAVMNKDGSLFGAMFVSSGLIGFQKAVLGFGVYLITLLCSGWLRKSRYMIEFLVLMLSALLGMYFMISSGNLLMFYLSLELATLPVAAMANFDIGKKKSSEAAMKMILTSAFSSGILLFGISLVYGATGSLEFSELATRVKPEGFQVMAFVFLFSAFAFKLSIVPFHLWTADVYEGSPIAVTSFLSVISKGSVAFIFITALFRVFQSLQEAWYVLVAILAVATMVIGNLFALRQDNIKRFLAFSSISQVGFILVAVSSNAAAGLASVSFFILVYVFSNLAAFGVAAVIADQTGQESIASYRGLARTDPFLAWVMAIALFSLAGIPPTAGFFGKMFLLVAGASTGNHWLILIAVLNMIVSLYYYLKVVRVMFMEEPAAGARGLTIDLPVKSAMIVCLLGIVLTGMFSWIYEYIRHLV
jgi:NADH-quinone oxidoreductase subunit N